MRQMHRAVKHGTKQVCAGSHNAAVTCWRTQTDTHMHICTHTHTHKPLQTGSPHVLKGTTAELFIKTSRFHGFTLSAWRVLNSLCLCTLSLHCGHYGSRWGVCVCACARVCVCVLSFHITQSL